MESKAVTIQKLIYWMCQIPGLGAVRIRRIYEACETIEMLYYIEGTELADRKLLPPKESRLWDSRKKLRETYFAEYEQLSKSGIQFITPFDEGYPARLRVLADYPMGLFVKGRLPAENRPTAAIIGARACSELGRQEAEVIASVLAQEGVQIISGLAAGIDGAGHLGALRAEKDTYAILGCGVNICYPSEHYPLYEKIIKTGGVISEYPLGTEPRRQNFPVRNRIISGLSDIIVVVEARERSGSLITVELGLEQGKEVFAVPGRMSDTVRCGCNRLIQQGANMVTSPYDIVEYLGLKNEKLLRVHKFHEKALAKNEKIVYSCLDLQPKHIDEIIKQSNLAVSECMEILLTLEIKGYVVHTAGYYYGKKCDEE